MATTNLPRTGGEPRNQVRGSGAEPRNQSSLVRSWLVRRNFAFVIKLTLLAFRDLIGSGAINQSREQLDLKYGLDEHK